MKKKSQNIVRRIDLFPWILGIFVISIWELLCKIFHIPIWILPSPTQILFSFWEVKELILYHSLQTIVEALFGLFIGALFAFMVAVSMEWSITFKKLIYPLLLVSQTIPFIALAPLLVIWFGFGISAKIIIVALVCFFPIAIHLYDGFRSVDTSSLQLLRSMGANTLQMFRFVKLPASLPFFFSGLRISTTYAILTALISEWIGADRGLGIFLIRASKSYLTDRVFAIIAVITILSLFFVYALDKIERTIIPWHYKNS